MFGKGKIQSKFPMLTDMLNTGIEDSKLDGMTWAELVGKGVISETVSSNDDGFTTITRKFISYDKTHTKEQTMTLETEFYDKYLDEVDPVKIKEVMEDLNSELADFEEAHAYEICAQIRDQILFLSKTFKVKPNGKKE